MKLLKISSIILLFIFVFTLFTKTEANDTDVRFTFQGYNMSVGVPNQIINPGGSIVVNAGNTYLEAGFGSNGVDPGPMSSSITAGIVGVPYSATILSVTGHSPSRPGYSLLAPSTVITVPTQYTMRFNITIKNSVGVTSSTTADAKFTVVPLPVVKVYANGVANGISVPSGSTVKITWSATNSSSCTRTDTGAAVLVDGKIGFDVPNMTSTKTFTIKCDN